MGRWRTHAESADQAPAQILEHHLAVCHALEPAVVRVIDDHLATRTPIVLDGHYLLPRTLVAYSTRVKAVFLLEDDRDQLLRNYQLREPAAGAQQKRAEVSLLFGRWLRDECNRLGLATVATRPWTTVLQRVIEAAG